jgi:hypothetical protein
LNDIIIQIDPIANISTVIKIPFNDEGNINPKINNIIATGNKKRKGDNGDKYQKGK